MLSLEGTGVFDQFALFSSGVGGVLGHPLNLKGAFIRHRNKGPGNDRAFVFGGGMSGKVLVRDPWQGQWSRAWRHVRGQMSSTSQILKPLLSTSFGFLS